MRDIPLHPAMTVRDVGLLDLARHAFMRSPVPPQHVQAETASLFGELVGLADSMPSAGRAAVLDACEGFALERAGEVAASYREEQAHG